MSSPAEAAATLPPSSSSSLQTEEMPPATHFPPTPAAAAVATRDQLGETEGEAVEEEEHIFTAQGYAPLVNVGEDEEEGMMPPPAAGGGWAEEEEEEEEDNDSEGDRREVDFEIITSRILAQMEAEYIHTRAQGGEDSRVPIAAAAAESVGNGVWERMGGERTGAARSDGGEEVAPTGIASLSLDDSENGGQEKFSFASSTSPHLPETPQSQDATHPSSSGVLSPPLPRSLPQEKEELIRRVMAGVVLPPQVTPAWATGVDWEGPELKSMLARLQGE